MLLRVGSVHIPVQWCKEVNRVKSPRLRYQTRGSSTRAKQPRDMLYYGVKSPNYDTKPKKAQLGLNSQNFIRIF